MKAIAWIYGFSEETKVGTLLRRDTKAFLYAVTMSDRNPNQLRNEMKQLNPFAEWLLRFTASQRNVDRVTIWLGGAISLLCIASAVAFLIYMLVR